MPGPDGLISVALDFDGSLVEAHVLPLRWRRGAREFIFGAAAASLKMYVHSCRCTIVGMQEMPGDVDEFYRSGRLPEPVETSWALLEEMRAFLTAEGVLPYVELWTAPGKPICDVYVDDRAEAPDWLVLAGELGVLLTYGPEEPQAVGGPVVVQSARGVPAGAVATGGGPVPARPAASPSP